jgi:hypothetical protein
LSYLSICKSLYFRFLLFDPAMQDFALVNLIQKGAKTKVFEPASGQEKSRPGIHAKA